MMLETLGNLGEFVSGIAVLITLIYLSVQVRQSNKTNKASSYHQVQQEFNHWLLTIASSEELTDIRDRGNRNPESLNEIELQRYFDVLMSSVHS